MIPQLCVWLVNIALSRGTERKDIAQGGQGYNAVTEGFGVRFLCSVLLVSVVGCWWGNPRTSSAPAY